MNFDRMDVGDMGSRFVPDAEPIFSSEALESALGTLREVALGNFGLMMLTGEPGAGKTTAVRLLQREFEDRIRCVEFDRGLFATDESRIDGMWVRQTTVESVADLVFPRLLEEFREIGNSPIPMLAIIDDAHMASDAELMGLLWAAARLRAAADGTHRPSFLLVGDDELDQRFRKPPLGGLACDLDLKCRMAPLSTDEVRDYVRFWLERSIRGKEMLFSDAAMDYIEQYSQGIPRLIDNICGVALVIAAEDEVNEISEALVRDAASDLLGPGDEVDSTAFHASEPSRPQLDWTIEDDAEGLDIPAAVGVLDLRVEEPLSAPGLEWPRHVDNGFREIKSTSSWLHHGVSRVRHRVGADLRAVRDVVEQRFSGIWHEVRGNRAFSVCSDRFNILMKRIGTFARHAGGRVWHKTQGALSGFKTLWETIPAGARTGELASSADTDPFMPSEPRWQKWRIGLAFTFSASMGVIALAVWIVVLTHVDSKPTEEKKVSSRVAAASAEEAIDTRVLSHAHAGDNPEPPAPTMLDDASHESIPVAVVATGNFEDAAGAPTLTAMRTEIAGRGVDAVPTAGETASDASGAGMEEPGNGANPGMQLGTTLSEKGAEAKSQSPAVPVHNRPADSSRLAKMESSSVTSSEALSTAEADVHMAARIAAPAADSGASGPQPRVDDPSPATTHVVAAGESLWSISRDYKVTIEQLRSMNGLPGNPTIHPGQTLRVRPTGTQAPEPYKWHTVRRGENLYRIGQRYGISVTALKALNGLSDPSQIKVGQRLRLTANPPDTQDGVRHRAASQGANRG